MVDVTIATLNSPSTIEVHSIHQRKVRPRPIVVADGGSGDGTVDIATSLGTREGISRVLVG